MENKKLKIAVPAGVAVIVGMIVSLLCEHIEVVPSG